MITFEMARLIKLLIKKKEEKDREVFPVSRRLSYIACT